MKKKIVTLCLVAALAVTAIGGTLAYFTDTTENVENTFTMGKVKLDLDEAKVSEKDGEYVPEDDRVKENDYTDINMVPGNVYPKDPTIHVEKGSEESYVFLDMTFNKYSSLFWVMAADADADDTIAFKLFDDKDELKAEFKNDKGVFSTTKFINYMKANKTVFQAMVNKWFKGIDHPAWEMCDFYVGVAKDDVSATGNYMTIRFAYNTTVNAKEEAADIDIKFMDSFGIPSSVTQEMIENGKEVGGMANNFNTDAEEFHLNFKAYAIQADELTADGAYKAMFDMEKWAKWN